MLNLIQHKENNLYTSHKVNKSDFCIGRVKRGNVYSIEGRGYGKNV